MLLDAAASVLARFGLGESRPVSPQLDGVLVVLVPPDVEPEALVDERADRLAVVEERLDEVGEVERPLGRDDRQHGRLERVDAHADVPGHLRLLLVAEHALRVGAVIEVEHAVVGLHPAPVRGDREHVAALAVMLEQRTDDRAS